MTIQCPVSLMFADMEVLSIILSILEIIIAVPLLWVAVSLVKLIKSNKDKTVGEIAGKINKMTTVVAILTITESVLLIVNIITR